jgi:hypothetical protein
MYPVVIRAITLIDSGGIGHDGVVLQHYHHNKPGMRQNDRGGWKPSDCLRVKLEDIDVIGEQDRRDRKKFYFAGIGDMKELVQ